MRPGPFRSTLCLVAGALALTAGVASAQPRPIPTPTPPTPPAPAPRPDVRPRPDVALPSGFHRLRAPAAFVRAGEEGGEPVVNQALRGVHHLRFAGRADGYFNFQISGVNWLLTTPAGEEIWFTGAGRYRVQDVGVLTVVPQHQLVLELTSGNGGAQRFDSGLVTMTGPVGRMDIRIDGPTGSGASFRVAAALVPAGEVTRYFISSTSLYGEDVGTECPGEDTSRNIVGSYGLIPLTPSFNTRPDAARAGREFAVVDFTAAPARTPPTPPPALRGGGFYRIRGQAPAPSPTPDGPRPTPVVQHRMQLALALPAPTNTAPTVRRFDSGWTAGGSFVPREISIVLRDVASECLTRVLSLRSRTGPVRPGGGG